MKQEFAVLMSETNEFGEVREFIHSFHNTKQEAENLYYELKERDKFNGVRTFNYKVEDVQVCDFVKF